jgi:hypothetical protein
MTIQYCGDSQDYNIVLRQKGTTVFENCHGKLTVSSVVLLGYGLTRPSEAQVVTGFIKWVAAGTVGAAVLLFENGCGIEKWVVLFFVMSVAA